MFVVKVIKFCTTSFLSRLSLETLLRLTKHPGLSTGRQGYQSMRRDEGREKANDGNVVSNVGKRVKKSWPFFFLFCRGRLLLFFVVTESRLHYDHICGVKYHNTEQGWMQWNGHEEMQALCLSRSLHTLASSLPGGLLGARVQTCDCMHISVLRVAAAVNTPTCSACACCGCWA